MQVIRQHNRGLSDRLVARFPAPFWYQSCRRGHRKHAARRVFAILPANAESAGAFVSADGARVVVVGAGIGGLATAGRLARAGFSVTVLEKNAEVS